jgi:creatinine amidohydrolase
MGRISRHALRGRFETVAQQSRRPPGGDWRFRRQRVGARVSIPGLPGTEEEAELVAPDADGKFSVTSLNIEQLGPEAVRRRVRAGHDTVLIPIGCCERHGNPYTPVGLDGIICLAVVERAAAKANALHTPLMPFGYAPMHMGDVGTASGAVTLRGETFRRVLEDIGRSLIHQGFSKLIFVTLHGPNVACGEEVLFSLRFGTGAFAAFYGGRESSAIGEIFGSSPERLTSDVEASLTMALVGDAFKDREYLAESYEIHAPAWLGGAFFKRSGTGTAVKFDGAENIHVGMNDFEYTSRVDEPPPPSQATPEHGERLLDSLSDHLAAFLAQIKDLPVEVRNRDFADRAR